MHIYRGMNDAFKFLSPEIYTVKEPPCKMVSDIIESNRERTDISYIKAKKTANNLTHEIRDAKNYTRIPTSIIEGIVVYLHRPVIIRPFNYGPEASIHSSLLDSSNYARRYRDLLGSLPIWVEKIDKLYNARRQLPVDYVDLTIRCNVCGATYRTFLPYFPHSCLRLLCHQCNKRRSWPRGDFLINCTGENYKYSFTQISIKGVIVR